MSAVETVFALGGALLVGVIVGFFLHDHLRRLVEAMVELSGPE